MKDLSKQIIAYQLILPYQHLLRKSGGVKKWYLACQSILTKL